MYSPSCRSCGGILSATVHCATCKESVAWVCISCEKMQDSTHRH